MRPLRRRERRRLQSPPRCQRARSWMCRTAVKAKFHTVKMAVGNRENKEEKEFNVKIGGGADVPGSPYKIKIIAYLPHWVIRGDTVTSNGINPDDPAVRAVITEGDKPVFDGFIFQKHKTPSFVTDKYVMTLTGAD